MLAVETRPFTLGTEGVIGTLYLPQANDPFPGVLLIGGSDGREPQFSAKRLAQEGFATLSLAYFGRPGLPPSLRDVPLEYFETALRALGQALSPPHGPLVVLGTSRGSEAAFLAGIHFPDLVSAVVGMVPGNVVLCSWPPGGPAWTLHGKPLPYVSRFGPTADDPEAEIPVEKIRGPVLLISAGADQVWPSTPMARAMISRLKAHGHPYADLHVDFPHAGHGGESVGGGGRSNVSSASSDGTRPNGADGSSPLTRVVEFLRRPR